MEEYFDFTYADLKAVEELSNALEPLKSAALMVCKKNATILDSESIMALTISEMQRSNSQINKQLLDALYDRKKSRRNHELVHLIEYLHDPKFLEKKKDQYGIPLKKKSIHGYAGKLICKMFFVEDEESEVEREDILDDVMESQINNLSFVERLNNYVEQSRKELPQVSSDPAAVEQDLIKQEFLCFERFKGTDKPKYLQALYQSLKKIPPTPVESERSVSSTGLFATKIRSRLGDSALDKLLF